VSGGAIRPLPRNGSAEKLHGDPTVDHVPRSGAEVKTKFQTIGGDRMVGLLSYLAIPAHHSKQEQRLHYHDEGGQTLVQTTCFAVRNLG